jgi:hypothetical protein
MEQLALTLAFTLATAVVDAQTLKNGYIYEHKSRFIQRLIFFMALGWYGIGGALIFAALFDQLLNALRGLPLWYLGDTAEWDKFWRKYPIAYKVAKVVMLVSGFYLILL